jgi:hypothetical protein
LCDHRDHFGDCDRACKAYTLALEYYYACGMKMQGDKLLERAMAVHYLMVEMSVRRNVMNLVLVRLETWSKQLNVGFDACFDRVVNDPILKARYFSLYELCFHFSSSSDGEPRSCSK